MNSSGATPELQPIASLQAQWLAVLAGVPKRGNAVSPPVFVGKHILTYGQRTRVVSIVQEHLRSGNRHDVARHLSGGLATAGVTKEQTQEIVFELFDNDPEIDDRLRCVDDTFDRLRRGLPVSSFRALGEHIPHFAILELQQVLPRPFGIRSIRPDTNS